MAIDPLAASSSYADPAFAHRQLAQLLRRRGQTAEALEWDKRAPKIVRRFAKLENQRGIAALQQGKFKAAVAHLRKSVAWAPDDPQAHGDLADALAQQGETDDATTHYLRALEIDPADPRAKSGLARLSAHESGPAGGR